MSPQRDFQAGGIAVLDQAHLQQPERETAHVVIQLETFKNFVWILGSFFQRSVEKKLKKIHSLLGGRPAEKPTNGQTDVPAQLF